VRKKHYCWLAGSVGMTCQPNKLIRVGDENLANQRVEVSKPNKLIRELGMKTWQTKELKGQVCDLEPTWFAIRFDY